LSQAGLFSGVVTTFIQIDSCKTLDADSGSQTAVLLSQISQQLVNLNNGTPATDALPPTAPAPSLLPCLQRALVRESRAEVVERIRRDSGQANSGRRSTSTVHRSSPRSRVYMYLYSTTVCAAPICMPSSAFARTAFVPCGSDGISCARQHHHHGHT
ncbi:unnamed protein product, partial [Mycena citricolor]